MAKERLMVRVSGDVLALLAHIARQRGEIDRRSSREDGLSLAPAGADAMAVGAAVLAALAGPGRDGRYAGLTAEELASHVRSTTLGLAGFLAETGKPVPLSLLVAPSGLAATAPAEPPRRPGTMTLSDDLGEDAGSLGVGLLDE